MSARRTSSHWNHRTRLPSRTAIALLLVAAHALVLWTFWTQRTPVGAEVETFSSILFFLPARSAGVPASADPPAGRASHSAATPQPALHPSIAQSAPPAAAVPPASDSGTAITPAAPAAARVDWSAQLAGAATAALENEKHTREQLGALLRKFHLEPDPRDPHPRPPSGFRWYEAGIHRFDTRGPLPVWHLNDRCVIVALIFAACAIGHIEIHGDLFEGAAVVHDEKLATPWPNAAP